MRTIECDVRQLIAYLWQDFYSFAKASYGLLKVNNRVPTHSILLVQAPSSVDSLPNVDLKACGSAALCVGDVARNLIFDQAMLCHVQPMIPAKIVSYRANFANPHVIYVDFQ